jgi:hypothetical protein
LKKLKQPLIRREFIVVNKGNEITSSVFYSFIPRQGDISFLLNAVINFEPGLGLNLANRRQSRLLRIVIRYDNRKRESTLCLLPL